MNNSILASHNNYPQYLHAENSNVMELFLLHWWFILLPKNKFLSCINFAMYEETWYNVNIIYSTLEETNPNAFFKNTFASLNWLHKSYGLSYLPHLIISQIYCNIWPYVVTIIIYMYITNSGPSRSYKALVWVHIMTENQHDLH